MFLFMFKQFLNDHFSDLDKNIQRCFAALVHYQNHHHHQLMNNADYGGVASGSGNIECLLNTSFLGKIKDVASTSRVSNSSKVKPTVAPLKGQLTTGVQMTLC